MMCISDKPQLNSITISHYYFPKTRPDQTRPDNMDDNNDPRFVSIKINPDPTNWTIRQIAKDTEAGRTFFYEHYRPFRLKMLEEAPHGGSLPSLPSLPTYFVS